MSFIVNPRQFQVVVRLAGSLRLADARSGDGVRAARAELDRRIRVAAAAEAERVFTAAGGGSDIVHHAFAVEGHTVVLSARYARTPSAADASLPRLVVEVEESLPGLTNRTVLRTHAPGASKMRATAKHSAQHMHLFRRSEDGK